MNSRIALLCTLTLLGALLPLGLAGSIPEEAEGHLDVLQRLLAKRAATNRELLEAMDRACAACRDLDLPADEAVAAELRDRVRRVEAKLLLKALTLKDVAKRSKTNNRHPVQMRAAALLAGARREAAPKLMALLRRKILEDSDYARRPLFYARAFRAVAALDPERAFEFLLDRGVNADTDAESAKRARAAIETLADMSLSGEQRRQVVRRLIDIFQSFTFHWVMKYDAVAGFRSPTRKYRTVSGTQTHYWMDIRPALLESIRHLSKDPRTGLPAFEKRGRGEIDTLPRWLNWFQKVQRKGTPPWIDVEDPSNLRGVDPAVGRHVRPATDTYTRQYGVPWQMWWSLHREETAIASTSSAPADADIRKHQQAAKAFRATLPGRLEPLLTSLLGTDMAPIRATAALGLARIGAKGAAARLRRLIEDDDSERVREAAVLGLLVLGDKDSRDYLRARFLDGNENATVRGYCLLTLGRIGDGAFGYQLMRAKSPPATASATVRQDLLACALHGLALGGLDDQADDVLALLQDEKQPASVRGHAGRVLARIGSDRHVDPLVRLLRRKRPDEDKQSIGVAIATALGRLAQADDKSTIRKLSMPLDKAPGQDGAVRNALALALGHIGGSLAEEALERAYTECLDDTNRYAERAYYLLAFGHLESGTARAYLARQLRKLDHEHDLGAASVASALVGRRNARTDVRAHVRGSERGLAETGLDALGLLGDPDLVPVARELLSVRQDAAVARSSVLALARTLGPDAIPDIEEVWSRRSQLEHHAALGWAYWHAASPRAEKALRGVVLDKARSANERAAALLALTRMAQPHGAQVIRTLARDFNPYASASATLRGLALHGDTAFLR